VNTTYEPLHLDETFDAREVALHRGQRMQLSLRENPTTGFRWELQENGSPPCALREDTFVAPATGGVGKAGTRRWLFEAVESGTCRIVLAYRRAWESKPPDRMFALTARVAP
jgi:inhibitor of cysteine peptidase